MNILKAIPWRKWIFVAGLVGLGINGLVQVTLQRDMRDKTSVLASQVQQAQTLSGKMTDSLSGLPVVEHQSEVMASTLHQLSSQTSDMDHGLAVLQQTVQGIANAVQSIGASTSTSSTSLTQALHAAQALLTTLQSIQNINGSVLANLNQMENDQQAINADLNAMNQKMALVP